MSNKWMWWGVLGCLILAVGCNDKKETVVLVDGQVVATVCEMSQKELSEKQKEQLEKKYRSAAAEGIRIIETAIDFYEMDVGKLPESLYDLHSSSEKGWDGPYIKKAEGLKDPWGNEFHYSKNGKTYKVVSGGPDGSVGGSDDIE